MKRLFKVIPLCAAALLFTAAVPGLAAAGQGGGDRGKGMHRTVKELKHLKLVGHGRQFRHGNGHGRDFRHGRGHGRDFRHGRGHGRDFRHGRGHRRHFKHGKGHRYGHYRHRYRHHRHRRHYGYRPYYGGFHPYFNLHFYPGYGYRSGAYDPPPAYRAQPQASYAQAAVLKTEPQAAPPPSSCLMTREYQTEIVVGGEVVPGYGEACLQPDGSWYRGPAVPEQY